MTRQKTLLVILSASALAACGGSGGGTGGAGGGGGGSGPVLQDEPAPPVPEGIDYADLSATTGTSDLGGAVLSAGRSATSTTGTIDHADATYSASGVSGVQSLDASSGFDLSGFSYATDVQIDTQTFAVVGVATDADDLRSSGSAAYSGTFAGQLVDSSSISATTLDWDADIQVSFDSGDVDMTFQGGGSTLIDTIRVVDASVSGNGISGGSLQTFNDGVQNDITGTDVDMSASFFGYDDVLLSPAELGGALQSNDANTDISGLFLSRVQP